MLCHFKHENVGLLYFRFQPSSVYICVQIAVNRAGMLITENESFTF